MLIFKGGSVVEVVDSPRKQAYTLIFEGGRGGGVSKEQPSSKTSASACFRRWRWCWPRAGGGGGDKEQLPLKMSIRNSFWLVFEDKGFDMMRRVYPSWPCRKWCLVQRGGVEPSSSCRYACKCCVVSYNTHNFVKKNTPIIGDGHCAHPPL